MEKERVKVIMDKLKVVAEHGTVTLADDKETVVVESISRELALCTRIGASYEIIN